MKKKNILHITTIGENALFDIATKEPFIGGTEKIVISLCKMLAKEGHSTFITCCSEGIFTATLRKEGLNLRTVDGKWFSFLGRKLFIVLSVPKLAKLIKDEKIDIIHAHNFAAAFAGGIAAKFCRIPIIMTIHMFYLYRTTTVSKIKRLLNRGRFLVISWMRFLAYMLSDRITTVSDAMRDNLVNAGFNKNIIAIPNAIEIDTSNLKSVEVLKQALGIESKDFIIGSVGRLIYEKGFQDIIYALKIVKQKIPNVKLVIVGDGEEIIKLKRLVLDLELTGNVLFTGFADEPLNIINIFHVFVFASFYNEGLPLVLLEAMSMCKPIIATEIDACRRIFKDKENALLVKVKDPEAIADAISELYSNKELRAAIADKAGEDVRNNFSYDKFCRSYLEVYGSFFEKKIKVLFIEFSSSYGGSSRSLFTILKALDKKKFTPSVIYSYRGRNLEQIEKHGVKTYRVKYDEFDANGIANKFLLYILSLNHFIFEVIPCAVKICMIAMSEKADILHLNNNIFINMPGIIAGWLKRAPVVTYIRCTRHLSSIEKFFVNFIDKFLVLTNSAKKHYSKSIPTGKIEVISDGIDLTSLRDGFPGVGKFHINGGGVVGIAGRIVEGKGHDDFLTAASIVTKVKPSAKFLIIGSDPTGRKSLETELRQRSERLCLGENVIFMGWRDDVLNIMSELDILIQATSTFPEGFGLTCIEAMALGKPVIATRIPGPSEIVVDNETGFLIPPKNPETMADKILTLLNDKELSISMGKAGRKRAEELFDIREITRKLESVYIEVLNSI